MKSKIRSLIWAAVAVAACAAILWLAVVMPMQRHLAGQSKLLADLEARNRELAFRAEAPDPGSEEAATREMPPDAASAAVASARRDETSRTELVRMLARTQDSLAAAESAASELRARVQDLEASVARVSEEGRQLADSEAEVKEKLSRSTRVVEAMQTELKGNSDRLLQLEVRNQALQQEVRQGRQALEKFGRSSTLAEELENLNRRRDVYLTSLLRRYKEVTDLYRNMALNLEDQTDKAPVSGAGLSRIQNALSMAEEDLRQLQTLNAQAASIQQRLRNP